MSDEGEESDGGERGHLSESPSPTLSVCLPRGGSPSSARPLDLFSSASPLLGDTDPPYLASPECRHPSPENRDSPHLTPPKLLRGIGDTAGSPLRPRRDVRLDAVYDRCDDPYPKWRGRGGANSERFQHHGQRIHRAPELSDHGNHHSAEHIDTEFNSESRHTWVTLLILTHNFC